MGLVLVVLVLVLLTSVCTAWGIDAAGEMQYRRVKG